MCRAAIHLLLLAFALFCFSLELSASERVTQETKGPNSPAQYVAPGGTGTITYKIDAEIDQVLSEVRKEFSKCLEVTIAFQNKKLEDLNKTLAGLLVQNQSLSDEDAKKWAKDIVEKAPAFKNEFEHNNTLIREYNEALSKNLIGKVYGAFTHIFEIIDSRLLSLKELSHGAVYETDEKFILFSEEDASVKPYTVRSLSFAKGNRISAILTPGKLSQGLVRTCPSLDFVESSDQSVIRSFKVIPQYGLAKMTLGGGVQFKKERTVTDIEYSATGGEILTDQFRKGLDRAFAEFVELAFTR